MTTVTGRTVMESKLEGRNATPRSNKEILSIHKNHRREGFKVFKNDEGRYNSPINATQKPTRIITFYFQTV